jgi:hypothetical protein
MSNTTTHQQTEPNERATHQTRTSKTREAREDAAKKLEAHGCNTLLPLRQLNRLRSELERTHHMSDAREAARQALNEKLDPAMLNRLLDEVLAITKQARGWCTHCKKAVMVEVSDPKAVVSALSELLTQAEGRPGTAETDQQTAHYYVFQMVVPDGTVIKQTVNGVEEPPGQRTVIPDDERIAETDAT